MLDKKLTKLHRKILRHVHRVSVLNSGSPDEIMCDDNNGIPGWRPLLSVVLLLLLFFLHLAAFGLRLLDDLEAFAA